MPRRSPWPSPPPPSDGGCGRISEIDPLVWDECGGEMRIIAFMLDPAVGRRIRDHLATRRDRPRAPPARVTAAASPLSRARSEARPLRWHRAEEGGRVARPDLDGRLPCRGLREAPLTGISKGPVDYILERYASQSPLPER